VSQSRRFAYRHPNGARAKEPPAALLVSTRRLDRVKRAAAILSTANRIRPPTFAGL